MCSDSDSDYHEDLFNEDFFKSLLSFMNESEDLTSSSSFGSCSSGYASEVFSLANVVTSGYSRSTVHYGDLIYKKCNFSNRLRTSWTVTAAGRTPSAKESPKISLNKNYEELMTPKSVQKDIEEAETVVVQNITSDFQIMVKDKHLMFTKFLSNSLLPEFQNHPVRTKQVSKGCVRSDSQVMPRLNSLVTIPKIPIACPISNQNKDITNPIAQNLKICKFCFKNGEPSVVYMGHFLKTAAGIVTCPILRKYICDICGATGTRSHTRKYCPLNTEPFENVPKFRRLASGVLSRSLGHK